MASLQAARQPALLVLGIAAAACITLVPASLIELRCGCSCCADAAAKLRQLSTERCCLRRYFTVPYMMVALHSQPPAGRQLNALLLLYAGVNAVTLWVYLLRPFRWPDGSVAHFMW